MISLHVLLPGASSKHLFCFTETLSFPNGCQGTQARGRLRGNRASKGAVAEGPGGGVEFFFMGGTGARWLVPENMGGKILSDGWLNQPI